MEEFMGGEKWYTADIDNILEMFGYEEKHENVLPGGKDGGHFK